MDLAGTLPGPLARFLARHNPVQRRAYLRAHWDELETRLMKFVRELKQTDLERVFEYKTLKFGVLQESAVAIDAACGESRHLSSRQITTMLRQHGAQPILTDLMHFYREREVAAGA